METPKAKLTIEYWPLRRLQKHPRNPKSHRLEEIHQSMDRFGYTSPILIDERSGKVCAGHGRIDTLLERFGRDPKRPPENVAAENGDWLVPVVRGLAFKSEAELEAYLIADNRLTEVGGWDSAKLVEILKDHQAAGTLPGTGFDVDALRELLGSALAPAPEDQWQKEWENMPEFHQKDAYAFRTIVVHFNDAAAVEAFARLLGVTVSDSTRWLWYPKKLSKDSTVA